MIEGPDDFLRLGFDFNEEWVSRSGMAIADDIVAIGQDFQCGDPGQAYVRKVVLVQLPDDLFLWSHLNDTVTIACADERVAVLQANS